MENQNKNIMIAPCGLNCSLCSVHLREKNTCPGCRTINPGNVVSSTRCRILNCDVNKEERQEFCYECSGYPCKSIKNLDKRYRTQYNVSNIENLNNIKNDGLQDFLEHEKIKWSCPACGKYISMHDGYCYQCKNAVQERETKEIWDLYDENRIPLGKKHIRGVPVPEEMYHIVVDIWVINKDRKILLTQRHPDKPRGLLWECTGGSIITGEDSMTGALRELAEEIGIRLTGDDLKLINSTCLHCWFVDTYITVQDITLKDLKLQAEEVVAAKFVTYGELNEMWEKGYILPRERFSLYKREIEALVIN